MFMKFKKAEKIFYNLLDNETVDIKDVRLATWSFCDEIKRLREKEEKRDRRDAEIYKDGFYAGRKNGFNFMLEKIKEEIK